MVSTGLDELSVYFTWLRSSEVQQDTGAFGIDAAGMVWISKDGRGSAT